jgi:hypothetical protein
MGHESDGEIYVSKSKAIFESEIYRKDEVDKTGLLNEFKKKYTGLDW